MVNRFSGIQFGHAGFTPAAPHFHFSPRLFHPPPYIQNDPFRYGGVRVPGGFIFLFWSYLMNILDSISSHCVPDADRVTFTTKLFGMNFPMRWEPTVFDMEGRLAAGYTEGYWQFYALSNSDWNSS
ncbi:hypothetical protein SBP18_05755 [Rhodoferax ferrireducens]|uniref:hypothetical protein n=1 Tax=Rhodoferax ferrireducens TaxID=192843 RepID=UPI00298E2338|nr:hypothetical protein [Rhodoferax ferrireducens]WPC68018.1 hypothetical protein SBP18_05755 [Rhodoferax ferrireducens]